MIRNFRLHQFPSGNVELQIQYREQWRSVVVFRPNGEVKRKILPIGTGLQLTNSGRIEIDG